MHRQLHAIGRPAFDGYSIECFFNINFGRQKRSGEGDAMARRALHGCGRDDVDSCPALWSSRYIATRPGAVMPSSLVRRIRIPQKYRPAIKECTRTHSFSGRACPALIFGDHKSHKITTALYLAFAEVSMSTTEINSTDQIHRKRPTPAGILPHVKAWVQECVNLCQPADIYWCNGSADERKTLLARRRGGGHSNT